MQTMSFHICMFLSHFPYQNTFLYPKMGTSSSDMRMPIYCIQGISHLLESSMRWSLKCPERIVHSDIQNKNRES